MKIHTDFGSIVLEVKNWKGTVTTAEVDKFYRDISSDSAEFGIFASFGRIAKKHRYELINYDGKWLLFIPECNEISLKLGIVLLRSVASIGSDVGDIKQLLSTILNIWKTESNKTKKSLVLIERELNKINKNLKNIDREIMRLEKN